MSAERTDVVRSANPVPMLGNKRLQNLVKLAFGLCVLAWLMSQVEFGKLIALARRGAPIDFALGIGFLLIAMLGFQWTRLHVLIKSYTTDLRTSLKIFYVGALFNNFLPSNIGGDAIRMMYLKNLRGEGWGAPFMLLMVYRSSSFALLVLGGLVYVVIEQQRLLELLRAQGLRVKLDASAWWVALVLLVIGAVAGVWLWRRLSAKLQARVLQFLRTSRAAFGLLSAGDAISLFVQTVLFHVCRMFSFYYLVQYMGQSITYWDLVFVVSATAVLAVLPVTIAGLGVMEASITGILVMYGIDVSAAGAAALVNRAVLLLSAAIGGVIYVRTRDERTPAPEPLNPSATSA